MSKRDAIGVIILDDAVGSTSSARGSLIETLPVVLPPNVALVLTATDEASLVALMPDARISGRVQMAPLPRRDAEAIAVQLLPEEAPYSVAMRIADAANGHPLVLTLLARQYVAGELDDLNVGLATESVELGAYYERIWRRVSDQGGAVWLLATIGSLRGAVVEAELLAMTPPEQRTDFPVALSAVRHLLYQGRRGLAFYHDSLRAFVATKVTALAPTVHRNVRDYCRSRASEYAKRNFLFHLLEAEVDLVDADLAACDQAFFDQAALACGDPELLLEDLGRVLSRAISAGKFIEVIRLLLLRNRVRFRYNVVFAEFAHELAIAVLGLREPGQALAFLYRQGFFVCGPSEIADLLRRLSLRGQRRTAEEFFQRFRVQCWAAYESGRAGMSLIHAHIEAAAALAGSRPRAAVSEMGAVRRLFEAQFEDRPNDDDVALMRAALVAQVGGEALWSLGDIGPVPQGDATDEQYAIQIALMMRKATALARIYGLPQRPAKPEGVELWDSAILAQKLERLCSVASISREVPAVIDMLIQHRADPALVEKLWVAPDRVALREENGVDASPRSVENEFDTGRVEGYTARDLPDTNRVTRSSWEVRFLDLARRLGRVAGHAARCRRDGTGEEQDTWERLEAEVWPLEQFTLYERAAWKDSYAIPEAASVQIGRLIAEVVGDFAPTKVPDLVARYLSFPDQCGLYTEGYRGKLRAIARRLAVVASDKRQVADLLRACVRHVANNVFNRSERVGEFLACAAVATDAQAQDLAEEAFGQAIASSLGPSWYKEAQFSLLTDTIEEARDPRLVASLWPSVLTTLELACGETTFQRFVRYEKQRLVGLLAESGDLSLAVSLYVHYVLPPLDVQAQRIERVAVDHISRWRGARFGVGEIDEQAGVLQLLGGLNAASSCRRWGLVELFWPGDDRHLEGFAEHARRAIANDDGKVIRERALRFLRADADDVSRANYLEKLESVPETSVSAFVTEAKRLGLAGKRKPQGKALPPPPKPEDEKETENAEIRMPGVFGRSGAIEAMEQKVVEARQRLDRGDPIGARATLVTALREVLDAEWGIWDGSRREELELLWTTGDVTDVTRSLAPLVDGTRHAYDWMIAAGLIPGALSRMQAEDRAKIVGVVMGHISTILEPESRAMKVNDEFGSLRQIGALVNADCAIDQLLVELLDHPNAHERERVADVIFWLLRFDAGELVNRLVARIQNKKVGFGREIAAGILHAFAVSTSARATLATAALDQAACVDDANIFVRYALHETMRLAGRQISGQSAALPVPAVGASAAAYVWELDGGVLDLLGTHRALADQFLRELCLPLEPEDVKALMEVREGAFNGRAASRGSPWEREAAFRAAAYVQSEAARKELIESGAWNPLWPEAQFDYRLTSRRDELLGALKFGNGSAIMEDDDKILLHRIEFEVVDKKLTEFEVFALLVSDVFFDGNFDPRRAREIVSVHSQTAAQAVPSELIPLTAPAIRSFQLGTMVGGDVTPSLPSQLLLSGMRLKESDFERAYWHERRVWRPWGPGPLPVFGAVLRLPKGAFRPVPQYDVVWVVRLDGIVQAVIDRRRGRIYRTSP